MREPAPNLERVSELVAAAEDAHRRTSYAYRFESSLAADPIKRRILADYERDLWALDAESWRWLKAAAAKRLIRNKTYEWEPLFDILNEAKGYAHLAALGCTSVQFIAPSYDYKTPDLKADLNGGLVLCEVKTINMSDDERVTRADESVSPSDPPLSDKFLCGKLSWTLRAAKAQLDAFPMSAARKIIFLVFNPDGSSNEFAGDYSPQLRAFLKDVPLEGVEVEIFRFPPFHFVTD